MESVVYAKNTLEFVTVAVQYCSFLEQPETTERKRFADTCVKLLPLLYLKATLLPRCEEETDGYAEQFVTETDYACLRNRLYELLGDADAYLEVFHPDMPYSDAPIAASLSEDLADIYQDIKNFTALYRLGTDEGMAQALSECERNFAEHWGQKLVNAMRPLHALVFSRDTESDFSENSDWNDYFNE